MKKTSKILIVASDKSEISELKKRLTVCKSDIPNVNSYKLYDISVDILISGIGIHQVIYNLMKLLLRKSYDLILNVGICGSFNEELIIGDSVSVIMDEFADIGITYPDNSFKTLFDEEFLESDTEPFTNGKLYNSFQNTIDTALPKVTAITVNTTSGNEDQIKMRIEKFNPDIETMEGAAVAFVCLSEGINFLQIRTVSNMVEARNPENWDIELAVKKSADSVMEILLNMNIHN